MTFNGHYLVKCEHCGSVVEQCRCPGPKAVRWVNGCSSCGTAGVGVGSIAKSTYAFGNINPDRRYECPTGKCREERFDGSPYGAPDLPLGSQYIPAPSPPVGLPVWSADRLFAYHELARGLRPSLLGGEDLPAVEELPADAACPEGFEYVGTDCARLNDDRTITHAAPTCRGGKTWDPSSKACVEPSGGVPWKPILIGLGVLALGGAAVFAATKKGTTKR